MARLVLVSFRLGGTDGVAIEAAKWISALRSLGHEVSTIAGEGVADLIMPGLAMNATTAPSSSELRAALEGYDLVIVENLASLPLNPAARDVLEEVLSDRAALMHHHDLVWQRDHLSHLGGPRDGARWTHVTINDLSRTQLGERGIDAVTLMNSFDCDPPRGNRSRTRQSIGITRETLLLLPTRAIPRKNIAGAIQLAEALDAVLWILGPPEDGFAPAFEDLIATCAVEVRLGLAEGSIHDAYAACDLVVMPSTWEGFGNPVLESVTHRRPLALYPYPVAREIQAYGFSFLALDDVEGIKRFLSDPDEALLEANLEIARASFNVEHLGPRLAEILRKVQIN